MVNDRNIEELLIQTNPVLDAEELRLSPSEVDARCASILERRGGMQTQTPRTERTGTRQSSRWRKPVLAFGISLVAILIAAGGVALMVGGGDPEVADEPIPSTTTTMQPTTTTLPNVLDGRIAAPAYAEVPSFTGTVEYYEHDPSLAIAGWRATVEIKHSAPMEYEAEVLVEEGEFLTLLGTGTVYFGADSENWVIEQGDSPAWITGMEVEPFRHLLFDGEGTNAAWDEMCGGTPVELGTETIAGQATTHVSCSTALEDYELWIDESTGIVMKMLGPLAPGDMAPYVDRDGGFEFTEIAFGPVATRAAPPVPADDAEFPPFHMEKITEGLDTIEVWYLDEGTVRETVIASSVPSMVGSYTLIADGFLGGCTGSDEQACEWIPLEEAGDYEFGTVIGRPSLDVATAGCEELSQGAIAGRSARRFACSAGEDSHELWYDSETGLLVKEQYSTWGSEVTLLETNPVYPEGIFEFVEMYPDQAPQPELKTGDLAPLWRAPLIGGGEFDLADYRHPIGVPENGSFVVVFNWGPGYCADGCRESLDVFQRLYAEYGRTDWFSETGGFNIEFVTVSEDEETESARVLDRFGITVPAVACWADGNPLCTTPEPNVNPDDASPWYLWGNPIPSTTVLDVTGTVVEVVTGQHGEHEVALFDLLNLISGR
ncbi:MAG: hypothetical protein ACR2OI_05005 [Acidimicrobiia bacterium]